MQLARARARARVCVCVYVRVCQVDYSYKCCKHLLFCFRCYV